MGKVYEYETRADMMLMDGNNHMRNSAYLDVATASRYRYFEESGYGQERLMRERIGAVIRWERIDYRREIRHCEPVRIELRISGASPRVSRYRFHNTIYSEENLCAILETEAGWLDMNERKLIVPPVELQAIVLALHRTPDFEELRESVRA